MQRRTFRKALVVLVGALAVCGAGAQTDPKDTPDLTRQPTLYVVAYAHLDTQWRWDYVTTIKEYLPKTMRVNFDWFEKYPHYIFNFSGANRYRMMQEYYPADFELVRKYVAAGRWFPAGSSMEENDVNSPSAESVIRQILYGKQYFRREFGTTSAEYMLPDCFGFPASLPSILAHCGIKGFSTQKLSASWQPAPRVGGPDSPEKTPEGIPFNVGIWEGPDGKTVIAALNPGSYGSQVTHDLSASPPPQPSPDPGLSPAEQQRMRGRWPTDWPGRIRLNGAVTGVLADYMYYGTGDTGGSAQESSIRLMEAIVTRGRAPVPPAGIPPQGAAPSSVADVAVGAGPVRVLPATSEQMFLDIKPDQTARLPRYKGDLELINHSAGSITSQTYLKRWNRRNEVLADGAEKAAVAAELLGGPAYPRQRLTDAWALVTLGQFHDIIPGTSIPKAYEYSWNDQVLALNQFAGVLTAATESVASALDTQARGVAIVVYNPLNVAREDVVEATVSFPGGVPQAVRAIGPDGKETPAQLADGNRVLFVAKVPSVGFAVYDLQPADTPSGTDLRVTASTLENRRYRVTVDANGDVSGIFDKTAGKELLAAPLRLAISTDNPRNWPAWNMDWDQVSAAPRAYVGGPARIRIAEEGPVRVAIEVARETEGSRFVQTVRLSAGDGGNHVEFGHVMDWNTKEANLKATFELTAANGNATYNWDIGTVERPTAHERQFEVASHQWIDLTDRSGTYGVTLLTDCKNASDKPNDNTLRLTLVRTPGTRGGYADQGTQDLGHHEFVYGLAGHTGDRRQSQSDWQAYRLNQPLLAFESSRHPGALGKTLSLVQISNPRVRVLALKKAEAGTNEYIVRVVELDGKPAPDVRISFAAPIVAAREVNGAEESVGSASTADGALAVSFSAFQPRTFAIRFGTPPATVAAVRSQPIALTYDQSVATPDGGRPGAGYFDAQGRALPAEMLSSDISYGSVRFVLGPAGYGKHNAVVPRGQALPLPAGKYTRAYVLAAADGDQRATFLAGGQAVEVVIQTWTGYIGQWDNRIWKPTEVQIPPRQGSGGPPRTRTDPYGEMVGLTPGFIKPAPVAWFASHRHGTDGFNEPYAYSYLFAYAVDLPAGAATLTLPNNDRIRILAVTLSDQAWRVKPVQFLSDTLERVNR